MNCIVLKMILDVGVYIKNKKKKKERGSSCIEVSAVNKQWINLKQASFP